MELVDELARESRLRKAILSISDRYDYVLVPRTALLSLMILMFLALSNTGGGAFIYFQF